MKRGRTDAKGDQTPKGIADIIHSLRHSDELKTSFKLAELWAKWPDIVGPKLMPFGRPVGIRDGTMIIEVVSAVWMHRYSYRKRFIMSRINKLAKTRLVEDVFFVLSDEEKPQNPQDGV